MFYRLFVLLSLVFVVLSVGCDQHGLGRDSDGDGLSDSQEELFGSDPHQKDTNGNGILDGSDPEPWLDYDVKLGLQSSVVMRRGDGKLWVLLSLSLFNPHGKAISGASVEWESSRGRLVRVYESEVLGHYFAELESEGGLSNVRAKYVNARGKVFETKVDVVMEIHKEGEKGGKDQKEDKNAPGSTGGDKEGPEQPSNPGKEGDPKEVFHLVEPGVNMGEYSEAGSMQGELVVMVLDGERLQWGKSEFVAFPGAYVQVDFPDGGHEIGYTDSRGIFHLKDERLKEAVNITVGAEGRRYVSYVGVDARVVSVGLYLRDGSGESKRGSVEGWVKGFWGEGGLEPFSKEDMNIFDKINIAFVLSSIRHLPLSSMGAGSILEGPRAGGSMSQYLSVPSNLVIAVGANEKPLKFSLSGLKPGKQLLFALAGVAGQIFTAVKDPYRLLFDPVALGFIEVDVKPGEALKDVEIMLNISLKQESDSYAVDFGGLLEDELAGGRFPNGLVLPVIDTGKGYIFVDVNTSYNQENFSNPIGIRFPNASGRSKMKALGLDSECYVVGLAGRAAKAGYDPPGISTRIHKIGEGCEGDKGEVVNMKDMPGWPRLPKFKQPEAPLYGSRFDSVGGVLSPGSVISWESREKSHFSVVRLNYMTVPTYNNILDVDVGGSKAHLLWEFIVAPGLHLFKLPVLSDKAPDYPVLVNYEPSKAGVGRYSYPRDVIEIELNSYVSGLEKFNFNQSFCYCSIDIASKAVSQDSYLVRYQ